MQQSQKNYYHFDYRDEVLDEISSLFDWNLKQKYKSLSEIKNILQYKKISKIIQQLVTN